MIEVVNVVVSRGVVNDNYAFMGEHKQISNKAENKFIEECIKIGLDIHQLEEYEMDGIISDGYYENYDACVCLSWPTLEKCEEWEEN